MDQNSTLHSSEANLDIQYTMALSDPIPNVFYSTGGRGPLVPDLDEPDQNTGSNEPYIDFLTEMLKKDNDQLPHTLTISYSEDEQSVPREYAIDICNKFRQLGARGVSVLFSSGDTGVAAACQTNDGKETKRFLPTFPAACPYVTSVGGTVGVAPERAASFSSGGFSEIWERPKWQHAAVQGYLKQMRGKWTKPLLYNPNGRGFPDVSAQGYHFHVFDKGSDRLISGTSASSPTMAGIIALINGARVSKGQPPLGWLNPFIYSHDAKDGWTDITNGGSTGCTGENKYSHLPTPFVANASWPALAGWDAVTGMVS
jgi:tripeptidyl-peptidase-1